MGIKEIKEGGSAHRSTASAALNGKAASCQPLLQIVDKYTIPLSTLVFIANSLFRSKRLEDPCVPSLKILKS